MTSFLWSERSLCDHMPPPLELVHVHQFGSFYLHVTPVDWQTGSKHHTFPVTVTDSRCKCSQYSSVYYIYVDIFAWIREHTPCPTWLKIAATPLIGLVASGVCECGYGKKTLFTSLTVQKIKMNDLPVLWSIQSISEESVMTETLSFLSILLVPYVGLLWKSIIYI